MLAIAFDHTFTAGFFAGFVTGVFVMLCITVYAITGKGDDT